MIKSQQYEQHQAINEFVDNSYQSFLDTKKKLKKLGQTSVKIIIEFHLDKKDESKQFISIKDNAGGIADDKFDHAFELANPEAYKGAESLNEFGVGMKQASLWFGDHFNVKTSAIGEDYETTVDFNMVEIEEKKEEILSGDQVKVKEADTDAHYTEVLITNTNRMPQAGARVIKEHLEDTYRHQLRSGVLEIIIRTNNQEKILSFKEPELLEKPFWPDANGPYDGMIKNSDGTFRNAPKGFKNNEVVWKKEFNFEMSSPVDYAKGFIAVTSSMKKNNSGLVIFRRGRGVLGTGRHDDSNFKYRPHAIFGQTNNQRYARVIGEIEVGPNSPVTNSKKLDWANVKDLETEFIKKLDEVFVGNPKTYMQCLRDKEPPEVLEEYLPLKRMAEFYRIKTERKLSATKQEKQAKDAVAGTTKIIEKEFSEDANWVKARLKEGSYEERDALKILDPSAKLLAEQTVVLKYAGLTRKVTVRVENEKKSVWYKYAENPRSNDLGVSVNMNHPFSKRFIVDEDGYVMSSLVRIVAGLAMAEVLAKETNNSNKAAIIREIFNELISGSLSKR